MCLSAAARVVAVLLMFLFFKEESADVPVHKPGA